MKNTLKYYKIQSLYTFSKCIVAVFMFILLSGACTKLEDRTYDQLVSSKFHPGQDDIVALLGPAYVSWQKFYEMANDGNWRQGYRYYQEISADELMIPARPNGWVNNGMYRKPFMHNWDALDVYADGTWRNAYDGVTNCNRIIFQIGNGTIPVAISEKDGLLAEMRVLRASYYFALCDLFGNVPIVTKFDVETGYLPEQSTRQQVYNFIVKEINESMPLLNKEVSTKTYGRFNKWAAFALLAKVYLNAGVYTGTPRWTECIIACDSVINSGKYGLESNRKDIFKTENQNSREIIFAIPFDEIYAQAWGATMISLEGESGATYNMQGGPWGGSCAVPQFIDTYDPDDSRLNDWIGGPQYSYTGQRLVGGMAPTMGLPFSYLNNVPSIDSTTEMSGYREGKYEYKLGMTSFLSNDQPLLRYADVLLMKSEAMLRTGNADGAAAIVSQVRERCFTNNPAKATVTGNRLLGGSVYNYGLKDTKHGWNTSEGGADIQYGGFLDELGWEFAQEGHRRTDMIRFGVFTTKSWSSHSPNGSNRILYPIPQAQINNNPNLKQNPGVL